MQALLQRHPTTRRLALWALSSACLMLLWACPGSPQDTENPTAEPSGQEFTREAANPEASPEPLPTNEASSDAPAQEVPPAPDASADAEAHTEPPSEAVTEQQTTPDTPPGEPDPTSEPTPEQMPEPSPPERPPLPETKLDIVEFVGTWDYGQNFQGRFQTLQAAQRAPFRALITAFARHEIAAVRRQMGAFGMSLFRVTDTVSNKTFWLLRESTLPSLGLGLYLSSTQVQREIVLQSPHPKFDSDTHRQGAYLLRHLQVRLLMIASLGRCNHTQKTSCSGSTSVCNGAYRISDVAHMADSHFQAAHEAIDALQPKLILQLHGFAHSSGEPSAFLSNGTKQQAAANSLVLKLRDAFNTQLKQVGLLAAQSCNDPNDTKARLCGTTNVQGRHTNGSTDACTRAASSSSNRWIHIEQRISLRRGTSPGPEPLRKALQTLFP